MRDRKTQGGYMGRFLGLGNEKAGNIGALVLITSFIILGIACVAGNPKIADYAMDIIKLTIGYVFGVSLAGRNN
jgi:hypothetical protein